MTGINGLLAFAGILSFLISEKKLQKILLFLVAFSVGALTGGAFFHLIPESLNELDLLRVALLVIVGFLVFLFIEKFLYWHHCHKNHCDEHPFTYLILFGDGIHNFIDGLIIASGFIISIPVGIITSILIMAHELPQEIGDVGVLVYRELSRGKALIHK
jgi:zinc and cadmium transporter